MRLTLSRPGAGLPYAVIHRPQTAVNEDVTVMLGGSYEIRRGNFSETGRFRLNLPPAFQHGDWLRLYWDDPEQPSNLPDYAGEVLGEPWREGAGEIETRGLDEKLKVSRWIGKASGDFPGFFGAVLALTPLPAGLSVSILPDIPGAVFEADTPSELLGDTIQAITPALGGQLIGVSNAGQIVCIDPETGLNRRFPWGAADMPAGSTNNYANCVRFGFEYPSGDKGYFEGRNEPEVTRMGAEVWTVEQVTAKEMGRADQPYSTATGSLTRTFGIPAQGLPPVDVTQTGDLAALLRDEAAARPEVVYRPDRALDALPIEIALTYGMGAASIPHPDLTGVREAAITAVQFTPEAPLQRVEAAEVVDTHGQITLIVTGTFDPAIPPYQTVTGTYQNGAGDLLDYMGGVSAPRLNGWDTWTPDTSGAGYLLTFPADVAEGLTSLRYQVSYINSRPGAGMTLGVLELLPGGRFLAELASGEVPGSDVRSFNLELLPGGDYQPSVQVTVASKVGAAVGKSVQAPLPYPLTSGTAENAVSPLTILRDQMVQTGGVRLEFDGLLTLPFGSSIELKPKAGGGTVAGAWVMPGGAGAMGLDVGYASQYGVPLALATETRARTQNPPTFTALSASDTTSDGWLRFAVRGAANWDGTGPPPDLTGHTLLLLGVQNMTDLRIKTPQLGNLEVYGAELLRYRAEPVREWTGRIGKLERISATGLGIFEGLTGPDVLLDVQKIKVNLDTDSMEMVCGSPLPSTTADAIAGKIKDIQRTVRRAGGA